MVTQQQIALEVGLDRTTVGAILNRKATLRVRPKTRQLVLDAANRLGYRPHRYAQITRKGKSNTIGIFQFSGFSRIQEDRVSQAAGKVLQHGYQVLASSVLWHPDGSKSAWNALMEARIEGLLLASPSEWIPTSVLDEIRELNLPTVAISGVKFPGIPQVRPDVRQGMSDLTRHLLGLGHRKLALMARWPSQIRDEAHCWTFLERAAGFQEAVAQFKPGTNDRDEVIAEIAYEDSEVDWRKTFRQGELAMRKLLQRETHPDAVLCSNDEWAHGALGACADAGVRVPQDIAVTGFNNETFGEFGGVRLTTVAQPTERMVDKAVELLFQRIRGETTSSGEELIRLPCHVVVRQSCGASLRMSHGGITRIE